MPASVRKEGDKQEMTVSLDSPREIGMDAAVTAVLSGKWVTFSH